ncbi:hypothetical protein P3X46_026714 [Hevea brasiliensis]|uniref:NPH3 domain-containing protein n=1 Tax=Hevea brasiliensis TaxID=3981 RepID=A0ABQ9KZ79_HEVBR|nr:hypothetical protein P3X46_026714 [Hevea brasiliensis]
MSRPCDLSIHVNAQETFFLSEKIVSAYSGKLKKIIKQEKRKTQIKNSVIEIDDFPGGMTEKVSNCNLLKQTEIFLGGVFYWSWNDILASLKSCESFFACADSSGLVQKLICGLLAKIAQHSDMNLIAFSSSSSSSSPETASWFRFSSSSKTTPESTKPFSSSGKQWWFNDLALLPPAMIEKFLKSLGAYGSDNNSLILTRFILHYLKNRVPCKAVRSRSDYGGLADTAVYGLISVGKSAFSCRGLLLILRSVSALGVSKDCRNELERLIGSILDEATLDDLLIAGRERGVYDVNLVLSLIKIFVNSAMDSIQRLKKVGKLIDQYLSEISPDQNLKTSKFLGVAKSLPDSARDCFDGVYRAIDMYLEVSLPLTLQPFFYFIL